MPIHHATLKKATRLGFTIEEHGDLFVLVNADGEATIDVDAKTISEMLTKIEKNPDDHDVEFGTDLLDPADADGIMKNKCGVMDANKHDEYEHNPHGPGCGDLIDISLRDAFTKSTGLDKDGIRECAGALWKESYETLNNGMIRMNVANRIRGFLRNNENVEWTIGTETGRFGVAFRLPKRKQRKSSVDEAKTA